MSIRLLGPSLAAGLLCAAASAQTFAHDVPLSGLGNGNPAKPFGITAEPVTGVLYVAIAGDFLGNNEVVAVIDGATDTVTGTIPAGLFPEDVAVAYDAAGQPTVAAVTNSTSGSVTVWDVATGTVLADVALPDPFGWGSCYPFGIAAGGPGFWVTTFDGSGMVYAVDTGTLQADPGAAFDLGGGRSGGRLLVAGGDLFIPSSGFTPTWTGGEGGLITRRGGAVTADYVVASQDGTGLFPAGQDLVRLPDGRLILGGTDFGPRLYLLAPDGTLERTLRLSRGGGVHGLAISPDGKLVAACDLAGNTVFLLDALNLVELSATDTTSVGLGYAQPNDAAFLNGKLYVSCQANEEVIVFDGLPNPVPGAGYAGSLVLSDPTPGRGGTVTATVSGPGTVALLVALDDQASVVSGVALDIGPTPTLAGWGAGSFSRSWTMPAAAGARGVNLFAQGVVDASGSPRPTAPRVAVIQ
ncbi:MAG: hypothetical protein D6702_10015 [Planctomycetota bacterium]|nr:MAG: hypothetical protein D6702_10015 [Planctomycetota bacterium]